MSGVKGLFFLEKIACCLILSAAVFCFDYADTDVFSSILGLAFPDAVKSDTVPTEIALTANGEIPVLKEYYLEFDEMAGVK